MKEQINDKTSKTKFLVRISICFALVVMLFLGVIYAATTFASKGELNGDGTINYADVNLLEMHLINLKQLPEDKLENADMNNDGKITVTDLTILIQKIENKLNYEVTLRDLKSSNYYPNKNEEITLSFDANVNYDATIKTITMNDEEYNLVRNEQNGNLYEIKINVGDISGVKEYKFKRATLTNGKTVDIDYTVKVDVLKQQPEFKNWNVEEDIEKSELNISFDIINHDEAFKEAAYRIIEEKENDENAENSGNTENTENTVSTASSENSENTENDGNVENGENTDNSGSAEVTDCIKAGTVTTGTNNINVKVEEGKSYKMTVCLTYYTNTGTLEETESNVSTMTIEKDLSLVINYNFELSNIETFKEKDEQLEKTEEFNIGEHIAVKFDSTNVTSYYPEEAIINGKTYKLTKENNTYTTYIEGFDSTGNNNINIEKVTLNNGKTFEINKQKQVKIIKNAPTVVKFRGNENAEEKTINTHIYVKDTEKTITNLEIKLFDEQDNEVTRQNLTDYLVDRNLTDETAEKDLQGTYYINTVLDTSKITDPNMYKIKIYANYSLLENEDTYTHTNEIILDEKLEALPVVNIKSVEVSNKYPEKNENVTLTYQIETNKKDAEITHIMVNNLKCIATKHVDEEQNVTYTVTLGVGENAGILDLHTTEFTFEGDIKSNVNNTVQVDVLKDKPTSEAFLQVDDTDNRTVTLTANIVDPDGAFISGKADLVRNSDNQVVATKTFNAESITFTIENVELETEYTLVAKMTYDRDTNTIEEQTNQNYVVDEVFRRRPIQLIAEYQLQVNNIKTYKGETETRYFERGEEVTVKFNSTNKTEFYPVKAIINSKEYELEKQGDEYKTKIPVVSEFGPKTVTIEKVILNNTKEIELTSNNQTRVGILKLRPTVTNFGYAEGDNNTINVSFAVNDTEETITGGKIIITDENGDKLKEEPLNRNSNGITFTKGVCEEYEIEILADYDLDTNQITTGDNEYTNQQLLKEGINISTDRLIEVKDIIGISLYSSENPTTEVTSVTEENLSNLDNYIVKVITKEMPIFYAKIKSYEKTEDGNLNFILDYDNVIQYENDKKQNKLKVTYGKLNNGVAENKSIEALIAEIEANPDGDFTLTQDYDVSYLKATNTALIKSEFRGTLNGNGHKIYNLNEPLFDTLQGATIQNLKLEKVNLIEATSRGSIANIATNTTVKNVHIKNLNTITKTERIGGIVGELNAGTIEECSVTNYKVNTAGHIRIGGIVGYMAGGTIRNCYVQGEVTSTQTSDGNGIGGILGHGLKEPQITIENCITKINYNWTGGGPRLNGGIIGLTIDSSAILKNNISLSTGTGIYKVCGIGINKTSINNYELEESELISNATGEIVKKIAKANITKEFFKDSANFDESIWDLEGASYEHLPTLKGNKQQENETETNEEEIDANLYIPEYDRIKNTPGFNTDKLIAYHNIQKLMPYYDSKYMVLDSTSISNTHLLNTKTIKHILPFADNKLVTYLTSKDNEKITSIKVVFTDYTVEEYAVNFEKLMGSIAIYKIPELNLSYAFGNYIINEDSEVINKLTEYISSLDYNTVLDPLTAAGDSRLYRDNYNDVIKNKAKEVALKILQNDKEIALMLDNDILDKKIEQELIGTEKLNKMLYAYNYYNRWYGFEIGGAEVSDIIAFEGNMYSDTMTLYNVVNEVFIGNINPAGTDGFYINCLKKYTGSSTVGYFLDYIISNIGGYENVDDWFTEYFGTRNILSEISVDDRPDILYRGWYQLKKNQRMILPVVTMPEASTYLITGPAHFQIGPAQLYHKNPETAAGRAEVESKVKAHSTLVKRHFTTLAGSFDSGKWNNYCIMCYDCTKGITGYRESYITIGGVKIPTGKIVPVYTQGRVGANQNFFKNFSEVFGLWQPTGSAGGVGNTAGFLWFIAQPGLTNYDTWTHEFEHALADKIMLFQRGMRLKMEIMTQGNVEQRDDWSLNNLNQDVGPYYFNTSFYLNKEGNATQNLTPERINTKEKLENYYKGQQNALDLLDYVEGKAFIKLTPEQQAKIATKMSQSAGYSSWGTITAEQATAMNLTSLEALYDNRIMLRPNNAWGVSVRGLTVINSIGADDYGYESIWVNRWYLGHWDGGYADAFSSKRNLFEMLGYAGVAGYVTYGSRASSSDLDAIRKITQSVTGTAMDWKQYKMSRYATVEENINNNKYIDVQYMIDRFTEALKNDANNGDRNISQRTNLRKIYYHYLKSATNDFVADPLGTDVETTHIKTAQELVEKINKQPYGYYVLDNDIDFSGMTTNVTQTFMGRLDGNGHKIIGNKIPIFNKIRYGYVGNLTLENTDIPRNNTTSGALANRIESSTAEKINVTGLKMFFGTRNDLALIGGAVSNVITRDCTVERLVTRISNKDEFVEKVSTETGGLFELTSDIDFTGYTATTNAVITGTFTGKIDGKGHTISNLTNLSLFANFRGTVENLNISNFTNTSAGRGNGDFVTAFAQETFTATFRNMKFNNITLSGRNNVAVVTGMDGRENANSVFENISVKNANVTGTGVYVSTFAGRKYNGKMKDIYVQGTLNVTGTENGGLVGSMQQGGTIENVITDVNITKTSNNYNPVANSIFNASLIGNIYNTPTVKNCVAFGSMTGYEDQQGNQLLPYKCVGTAESQVNACLTKCYEITEETGASRVNENTAGHLETISNSNLNAEFYRGLGFDETKWDFTKINATGYPELK